MVDNKPKRQRLYGFLCTQCGESHANLHPVPCCSVCAHTICSACFLDLVGTNSERSVTEIGARLVFEIKIRCPECQCYSTAEQLRFTRNQALYDMCKYMFTSQCPRCRAYLVDSAFSSHVLECLPFTCTFCALPNRQKGHVDECLRLKCLHCPDRSIGNEFSASELLSHLAGHRNFDENCRTLSDHANKLGRVLQAAKDTSKLESIDFTLIQALSESVKSLFE